MEGKYQGATAEELASASVAKQAVSLQNQAWRFPHEGAIRLEGNSLVLEGWLTLSRGEVVSAVQEFREYYSRLAGAGVRGQHMSFGAFGKLGAPLILELTDGSEIALLVDFNWILGTTKNRTWLPALQEWVAGA